MTTETCGGVVWCACCSVVLWVVVVLGPPAAFCLFGGLFGGGLVVVCIVDAGSCSVRGPPLVWGGVWCALSCPAPPILGVWGGWGCVFVLAC